MPAFCRTLYRNRHRRGFTEVQVAGAGDRREGVPTASGRGAVARPGHLGPDLRAVRLAAVVRWRPRIVVQTTGSAPIFVMAMTATVLVVTLWLLLWRNR